MPKTGVQEHREDTVINGPETFAKDAATAVPSVAFQELLLQAGYLADLHSAKDLDVALIASELNKS